MRLEERSYAVVIGSNSMFTGLIEGTGEVKAAVLKGWEMKLSVMPLFDMSDSAIGDSISVSGVCLSINSLSKGIFGAYASGETIARSTLGRLRQGDTVNLERALRFSDRLGGHMVSGHVDGTGAILRMERLRESWVLRIEVDESCARYLIEKGSVAVDGISLTINHCKDNYFEVNIVPETARTTTILKKRVKDLVNIETDLIAKYIEKFLLKERKSEGNETPSVIDREMLETYGFKGPVK